MYFFVIFAFILIPKSKTPFKVCLKE